MSLINHKILLWLNKRDLKNRMASAILCVMLGIFTIIYARMKSLNYTEGQALAKFWKLWFFGGCCFIASYYLSRKEN